MCYIRPRLFDFTVGLIICKVNVFSTPKGYFNKDMLVNYKFVAVIKIECLNICWYLLGSISNSKWTMMAKPIKTLQLHYLMIQFLINK